MNVSETNLQNLFSETINQFSRLASELLPDSAPGDLEQLRASMQRALKKQLESQLSSMDVVSKDEFAAHSQLLNRLKDRIITLEERIEELEKQRSQG